MNLVYFPQRCHTDQRLEQEGSHMLWVHLQRRCFDVAGVAMRTGTLRSDTLKASARVDASCPAATVVLLAQTFVHIWKNKQWGVTDKHGEL